MEAASTRDLAFLGRLSVANPRSRCRDTGTHSTLLQHRLNAKQSARQRMMQVVCPKGMQEA